MGRTYSIKEKLGTLVYDWPRFLACMAKRQGWMHMRNRNDQLKSSADGKGVECDWEYTRTLHLCDVFPITGSWLMKRALQEYPIESKNRPDHVSAERCCWNGELNAGEADLPEVSILIGHRGINRLPLLQLVLKSFAAQQGVRFEVVVVEQDSAPLLRDKLPDWVRYVHNPCPPTMAYNRSQAFNVAADYARAPLLVLHDNDMMVPTCYAAEMIRWQRQGFEIINLKRFIFYLAEPKDADRENEDASYWCNDELSWMLVGEVVENLEGGGSLSIRTDVYNAIGGFDEDFVGWGGEDNEFWDRCLTRNVYEFAYLPIVHLWHPPQSGKRAKGGLGSDTAELTRERRAIPTKERIRMLNARERCNPQIGVS